MNLSRIAMATGLALVVAGCGAGGPAKLQAQLTTGAAVAAHQLCGLVFVSGFELDRARELYVDPLLRQGAFLLRVETQAQNGTVMARLPGAAERRAIHRPGYGCTLDPETGGGLQALAGNVATSAEMALDLPHRDAFFEADQLDAALDRAFRQDPGRPLLNTLAVVVLHDGRLVAERYAEGITPGTRLPGWSMTKSVTATLIGVLAGKGLLDVDAPGAIREWRAKHDPRSQISLDQLLRMTSGLLMQESGESGDGLDPTYRMLYREPDAAHFAATRALGWDVGTHFEYMSGSSVLAMRAAQDAIGGDVRDAHEFVHANLFDRLNMQGAVLEPDAAGTFLGSTNMLASARDWARLGQLYVDGGMAGERRILPKGWLAYVTTPTAQSAASRRGTVFWEPGRSAYGAGFWLFPRETREAGGAELELPADTFDANGFQGQYLHIIPSERLVVVRLGATNFRGHDHDRLPREVLAARKRG